MSESLEGRLGKMERSLGRLADLEAIRQLFVDYGHHLDRGDVAAYADLFATDGEVLLGPLGRARGREQIRALMTKALAGVTGNSFHLIANPIVALEDGADRATAEVTWAVVARSETGAPELSMLGRHVDQLVREQGRWLFLRREGHIDLPRSYPGSD